MLPRLIENTLYQRLTSLHKVILLRGAHQVGKTILLGSLLARLVQGGKAVRYLNRDRIEARYLLASHHTPGSKR